MANIVEKIKMFIFNLNEKGIPIPLVRDPIKDGPSVTLTFVILSGLTVFVGLIGKWSQKLGEIDTSGAMYWFMTCCGLYLGRKMTSDSTAKKTDIDKEDK